jgi:spore coat polysaccharide biosynthesis predicted glycosyltransferase SpsG
MKKKLVLMGTGGRKIGFGHVSRLKNLQVFLEDNECDCQLLVNEDPSIRKFTPNNTSYFDLANLRLEDYDLIDNILIIDSYIIPDIQFKKASYVRIDDFCDLPKYSADIIINPNLGSEKYSKCYITKGSKDVKLLLGGENVILHPNYYLPTSGIEEGKLAIFLGANDGGCTEQILTLLEECEETKNVKKIVLVVTRNYDKDIRDYKGQKTTVHQEMESLFPVIKDAEWGISSAGVTKYEFASLGIPVLLFALIEHQIEIGVDFQQRGLGIFGGLLEELNTKQLKEVISKLLIHYQPQSKRQSQFEGIQNLYNEIMLL